MKKKHKKRNASLKIINQQVDSEGNLRVQVKLKGFKIIGKRKGIFCNIEEVGE